MIGQSDQRILFQIASKGEKFAQQDQGQKKKTFLFPACFNVSFCFQTSTRTSISSPLVKSPTGIRTTVTKTTTVTSPKKHEVEVNVEGPSTSKKEETFNKEVTETKTTIEDSPVREGNRERFKRTTITEKEEKIHKTQVE